MGPFFVGIVNGAPMIVDADGRVVDRSTVEKILRAGLNLWDWSGGQIEQQHEDVARTSRRRAKR